MELIVIFAIAAFLLYCTDWGRQYQAKEDAKRAAKQQARLQPGASCPTCHNSGVERVTLGTRAVSGVMGGLIFSKKARAQFHCLTCNYYW